MNYPPNNTNHRHQRPQYKSGLDRKPRQEMLPPQPIDVRLDIALICLGTVVAIVIALFW